MSRNTGWNEKLEKIKETYPDVDKPFLLETSGYDTEVLTRVMGDLVRSEAKRSKPGKRPNLDRRTSSLTLAKLMNEDYSELEFYQSFRNLTQGMSIRGISAKTNINTNYVFLFLNNERKPSIEHMVKIAKAYGKEPSYFLEYRIAVIKAKLENMMIDQPDVCTSWYDALRGSGKIVLK